MDNIQAHLNQNIIIYGWINTLREHKNCIFIELRCATGILQVVTDKSEQDYTLESVIEVHGKLVAREADQINSQQDLGYLELQATRIKILSKSKPLPFAINSKVNEELQLKYRYLHFRSQKMQHNLKVRAKLMQFLRNRMTEEGFMEVTTPILTASSPEGARDYLVPSRLHPGKYYALPQSPQIFKQLLMVGGIPRYFSIAPCFRDEDSRKDRLVGEFYQLDFEMSFPTQEMILNFLEKLMVLVLEQFAPGKSHHVQKYTYEEAINKYCSDKPDLRYDISFKNYEEYFQKTDCQLFTQKMKVGQKIIGIKTSLRDLSPSFDAKKFSADLEKQHGILLGFAVNKNNLITGTLHKFVGTDILADQEVIFFICDFLENLYKKGDTVRRALCSYLTPRVDFSILFITHFPMFEKNEDRWEFLHNPFSAPLIPEDMLNSTEPAYKIALEYLQQPDLSKVIAQQYDLVMNGYELASGSIRNAHPEVLLQAFLRCGYESLEVREKFKCMFEAFQYGVPPHGGAAIGLERLLMLLLEEENVRNVTAFPLNTNGTDCLTGAPTTVSKEQLKVFQEIPVK